MFIDYLGLLLINMLAGLAILACYLGGFLSGKFQEKSWSSVFFIVGAIAFICGLHMTLTWPLPGSYNIAFGELSVLFGAVFLAAGFSIAREYSLFPVSLYAAFAGMAAVVVGLRIICLGLTNAPFVSGLGFILTGGIGLLLLPMLLFPKNRWLRMFCFGLFVVCLLLWGYTGYFSYWGHLKSFTQWKSVAMR